jgi:hypothetical protein
MTVVVVTTGPTDPSTMPDLRARHHLDVGRLWVVSIVAPGEHRLKPSQSLVSMHRK